MKKLTNIFIFALILSIGTLTAQTTITGTIETSNDGAIANVNVSLLDSNGQLVSEVLSTTNGTFTINAAEGGDYTLDFSKNGAVLDGVSTLDLVLSMKHILQISTYDSFYSILAMDVNGNGMVTTLDMVLNRKVILAIDAGFPIASWSFLEKMADPTNFSPPPSVNSIPVSVVTGSTTTLEIIGVKTGDVNDSNSSN